MKCGTSLKPFTKTKKNPCSLTRSSSREAQQAYSRGDRKTELQHYRKVLGMLHIEGRSRFHGLTGTPKKDKDLESRLSILLGQEEPTVISIDES